MGLFAKTDCSQTKPQFHAGQTRSGLPDGCRRLKTRNSHLLHINILLDSRQEKEANGEKTRYYFFFISRQGLPILLFPRSSLLGRTQTATYRQKEDNGAQR